MTKGRHTGRLRAALLLAGALLLLAVAAACAGGGDDEDGGDADTTAAVPTPAGRVAIQLDLKGNEAGAWLEATNLRGAERVTLTRPPELTEPRIDSDAAWSPQGDRLTFVRQLHLSDALYVVNGDGSGMQEIVRAGRIPALADPVWSPDGKRLAVVGEGTCAAAAASMPSLYVLNANGKGLRKLPVLAPGEASFPGKALDVTSLQWSPDGKTLLYVVLAYPPGDCIEGLEEATALYAVDVASGKPRKLRATGIIVSARWSPDGKQIATSEGCERLCKIVVLDRAGRTRRVLSSPPGRGTEGELDFVSLAWSPSGDEVVFAHGNAVSGIRLAGGKTRRLATVSGDFPEIEAVSPKGQIAISSFDFETTLGTLFVVDTKRGGVRRLPFPRASRRQADVANEIAVYLP